MNEVSPILLIIAIVLDVFGLICLIFSFTLGAEVGESLSFVPDMLGFALIGGNDFFKTRRKKFARLKTIKKRRLKFMGTFIGELLPFIGAFPFWTVYVIKNKNYEA